MLGAVSFGTPPQTLFILSSAFQEVTEFQYARSVDGPNNQIVQRHDVYIRRPGPQSETPRTAREWDELFTKCLDGRRDELLDRIRDLLIGMPPSEKNQTETSRLDRWVKDCEDVWRKKIASLPPDSPARCPHGFYTFAYHVDGGARLELPELLDVLRDAPSLTGWNTWWVPTRHKIKPYASDDAIECWIGGAYKRAPSRCRPLRLLAHKTRWTRLLAARLSR